MISQVIKGVATADPQYKNITPLIRTRTAREVTIITPGMMMDTAKDHTMALEVTSDHLHEV